MKKIGLTQPEMDLLFKIYGIMTIPAMPVNIKEQLESIRKDQKSALNSQGRFVLDVEESEEKTFLDTISGAYADHGEKNVKKILELHDQVKKYLTPVSFSIDKAQFELLSIVFDIWGMFNTVSNVVVENRDSFPEEGGTFEVLYYDFNEFLEDLEIECSNSKRHDTETRRRMLEWYQSLSGNLMPL